MVPRKISIIESSEFVMPPYTITSLMLQGWAENRGGWLVGSALVTRVVRTYVCGTKNADSQNAQGSGEMAARLTLPIVSDAAIAGISQSAWSVNRERLADYGWLVHEL